MFSPKSYFDRENENRKDESEDLGDDVKNEEEAMNVSETNKCYVYGQCQVWSLCKIYVKQINCVTILSGIFH